MDPTKDVKRVPHGIAKEMQAELKGAVKPSKAQLLTGCGIIGDTSPSVHGTDVNELKEQLNQLQKQLQLLTKSGS